MDNEFIPHPPQRPRIPLPSDPAPLPAFAMSPDRPPDTVVPPSVPPPVSPQVTAPADIPPNPPEAPPNLKHLAPTLALASQDVRRVLKAQNEQGQILTTKLNILFVSNGALLTNVSLARLMVFTSWYSLVCSTLELVGFLVSFTLLILAFFPRPVVVSPNLEDRQFLERYLTLSAEEYQLQMLVNLVETYNANKQRLDDVSLSLRFASYATWTIAAVMLIHMVIVYSFR